MDAAIDAHDAEGDVLASTRTDADGHYSLTLDPGSDTVVASTGAGLPICQPVTIIVTPGPPVRGRHQLRHRHPLTLAPPPVRAAGHAVAEMMTAAGMPQGSGERRVRASTDDLRGCRGASEY